jgi:hypothetical protein
LGTLRRNFKFFIFYRRRIVEEHEEDPPDDEQQFADNTGATPTNIDAIISLFADEEEYTTLLAYFKFVQERSVANNRTKPQRTTSISPLLDG